MGKSVINVVIGGEQYPCRVTMGAMRRFKQLSGKEASEIDLSSMSDVAELLYCCTASACNADHIAFNYSCDDFCDALDADEFQRLAGVLAPEEAAEVVGTEKKSRRR